MFPHPPFPTKGSLQPRANAFVYPAGLQPYPGDRPTFSSSDILKSAGDAVKHAWRLHGSSSATIQINAACLRLTSAISLTEAQGAHIQLGVECDVILELVPEPTIMGPSSTFVAGAYLRVGDDAAGIVWRLDAEVTSELAYPTIGPLMVLTPVVEGANFDFSGPGFSIDIQTAGADDVIPSHRGPHLFRLRRVRDSGDTILTFFISHNGGLTWSQVHSETFIDDSTATQLGIFAYSSDGGGGCWLSGMKFLNPVDEWGL